MEFTKFLPIDGEIKEGDFAMLNPIDASPTIGRCVGFQKVGDRNPIFEFYRFRDDTYEWEIFKNAFEKHRYMIIARAGEWRVMEEFPAYEICVDGRIRTIKTQRIRIASPNSHHYAAISFKKGGKMHTKKVHRLLGDTFIPNPHGLSTINHINHIRTDNSLINLEWSSQQDNVIAAYKIGRGAGERQGSSVLTSTLVLQIRSEYATGDYSFNALAKKYGTCHTQISRIVRRQIWKHI